MKPLLRVASPPSRIPLLALFVHGLLAASTVGAQAPAPERLPASAVIERVTPDSARRGTPVNMDSVLSEAEAAVRARGGVRADSARLLLTWKRPWGVRGAQTNWVPNCGDSTTVDTLYLSFRPGRTSERFNGFSGTLHFRPLPGDSLGPYWNFEKGGANAGGVAIEFGPDDTFAWPQPWKSRGIGQIFASREGPAVRLLFVYAVNFLEPGAVHADSVYVLGRVLFRHRRSQLDGCAQPVCVEWSEASLAFAMRDEPRVSRGERFVGWGDRGAAACVPYRGPGRTRAWQPR